MSASNFISMEIQKSYYPVVITVPPCTIPAPIKPGKGAPPNVQLKKCKVYRLYGQFLAIWF